MLYCGIYSKEGMKEMDLGWLPYLVVLTIGIAIGMIYGMYIADEWYAEKMKEREYENGK